MGVGRVFRPFGSAGIVKARQTRNKRIARRVARKNPDNDILEIARAVAAVRR